jgi:hypothetical protein
MYNTNRDCVYCAVGNKYVNIIQVNFSYQGLKIQITARVIAAAAVSATQIMRES